MLHLTNDKLQELSDKWLRGDISAEELELLEKWYNQESPETIKWEGADTDETELADRLFANIVAAQQPKAEKLRLLRQSLLFKVAASLFVLFICAMFWVIPYLQHQQAANNNTAIKKTNQPGNAAILTLANGKKVILNEASNGLLAKQGNTQVLKAGNGALVYSNASTGDVTAEPQINSISTPVGGQYQISLADGSKVWLNALSTLKYPTAFTGKQREVELTGEAYFEVEKNKKMPFIVHFGQKASIEVLGTHFNVMAYPDEKCMKATLLEGSVKVNNNSAEKIIVPGQQAELSESISVTNVNAEESIAWKRGLFSFDRADTQNIMRQIGRWYGVEIAYQAAIPGNQLTGYISRSSSLPEVLKMLQISGLHTVLNNNKLTVLPN